MTLNREHAVAKDVQLPEVQHIIPAHAFLGRLFPYFRLVLRQYQRPGVVLDCPALAGRWCLADLYRRLELLDLLLLNGSLAIAALGHGCVNNRVVPVCCRRCHNRGRTCHRHPGRQLILCLADQALVLNAHLGINRDRVVPIRRAFLQCPHTEGLVLVHTDLNPTLRRDTQEFL